MKITNNTGISLIAGVWLLNDEYDHIDNPNYFSATTLMKPSRMVALRKRIDYSKLTMDLSALVASSFGSALHDSVEKAWRKDYRTAMKKLGYSDAVIDRIVIDPTDEQLANTPGIIPIYFEQRSFKQIEVDGVVYTVGGKYDRIADGIVGDNKSTSTFAYGKEDRKEDYTIQLSIYRWLNPDKIKADFGHIDFFFTDWQAFRARQDKNYPQSRIVTITVPLLTLEETEAYIVSRIREHRDAINAKDQQTMVRCTARELWMPEPEYRYFADPVKANTPGSRATRKFDTLAEAQAEVAARGKGVVVASKPEPKRCGYCEVFTDCQQKDEYF